MKILPIPPPALPVVFYDLERAPLPRFELGFEMTPKKGSRGSFSGEFSVVSRFTIFPRVQSLGEFPCTVCSDIFITQYFFRNLHGQSFTKFTATSITEIRDFYRSIWIHQFCFNTNKLRHCERWF